MINAQQEKYKKDTILQEYFRKRIQWCVTALTSQDFKEAKRLFEAEDFGNAESWFGSVYDVIYSYVEDFDINKESLDGVLESLRAKLINISAGTLNDIDEYRKQIIENSDDAIKDDEKLELPILIMLLDSAIYQRLSQKMPEIKKQSVKNAPPLGTLNGVGTKIYGDTLYLVLLFIPVLPLASYELKTNDGGSYTFYGKKPLKTWQKWWKWGGLVLAIIIAISSMNGSSSTNSSSTTTDNSSTSSYSAWQTCSNEYDNLKSQLDSTNSTMDGYESAGNTEAFNNLVPQQNSLVQQLKDKATECNNLR
jgi:hypothetical protein